MTIKILQLNESFDKPTEHTLREAGNEAQFIIVTSEEDALQRLQREQFDLLVLEYFDENFLVRCRSVEQAANVLTMMTSPKGGPHGFVRAPLLPYEANVYIDFLSLLVHSTFLDTVNKLLAGASTQTRPGDEGYLRCKNADLAVAFDYPAFWIMPGGSSYDRGTFRRSDDRAVGPKNRRDESVAEFDL